MRIVIGDFIITSDANQFVINRPHNPGDKSKQAGQTVDVALGYFSTLESCLKGLPRHICLRSEATSLKEILTELKKYRELIENAFYS